MTFPQNMMTEKQANILTFCELQNLFIREYVSLGHRLFAS